MSGPFWLSHHAGDEVQRTYRLGRVHLCARCLGTYPVLFLTLALQLAGDAPLVWVHDGPWSLGFLLPAVIDWAHGRLRPRWGSNAWRTGTGVLLGLALGRTLYIHLRAPLPGWLLLQAAIVIAVAIPVLALGGRARRAPR